MNNINATSVKNSNGYLKVDFMSGVFRDGLACGLAGWLSVFVCIKYLISYIPPPPPLPLRERVEERGVVDQCYSAGRELAPVQIMGGEVTPTPLALQLVEGVLGIRPIPVELAQRQNFVIEISHQHGVLIAGDPLAGLAVGFDEAQQLLAICCRVSSAPRMGAFGLV